MRNVGRHRRASPAPRRARSRSDPLLRISERMKLSCVMIRRPPRCDWCQPFAQALRRLPRRPRPEATTSRSRAQREVSVRARHRLLGATCCPRRSPRHECARSRAAVSHHGGDRPRDHRARVAAALAASPAKPRAGQSTSTKCDRSRAGAAPIFRLRCRTARCRRRHPAPSRPTGTAMRTWLVSRFAAWRALSCRGRSRSAHPRPGRGVGQEATRKCRGAAVEAGALTISTFARRAP